jgi:hypothetical protein
LESAASPRSGDQHVIAVIAAIAGIAGIDSLSIKKSSNPAAQLSQIFSVTVSSNEAQRILI